MKKTATKIAIGISALILGISSVSAANPKAISINDSGSAILEGTNGNGKILTVIPTQLSLDTWGGKWKVNINSATIFLDNGQQKFINFSEIRPGDHLIITGVANSNNSITASQIRNMSVGIPVSAVSSWIHIANFSFRPSPALIFPGETITWVNDDVEYHTVTADDGSFDSGLLGPGETYTRTFTGTSTITYHCTPHPNMHGTIQFELGTKTNL